MIISKLTLSGFKKHQDAIFDFTPGSNLIVGPNYSGKSSLMQAIMVGLWGNSAVAATTKELVSDNAKDFFIQLELSRTNSPGIIITRTSKDSSIQRIGEEPYARGHSAVNKAVAELLNTSRNVFTSVFTSEQGSPQKLLDMEGAELQKFIEVVLGIDVLDSVIKAANRQINSCKDKTEALDYMVLPEEQLELAMADQASMQTGLRNFEANGVALQSKLGTLGATIQQLNTNLSVAKATNQAISGYLKQKAEIEAALSSLTIMPIVPLKSLKTRFDELQAQLTEATNSNLQQQAVNQAHRRYQDSKQDLESALAELSNEPMYDVAHLESKVSQLRVEVEQAKEAKRIWAQEEQAIVDARLELQLAEEAFAPVQVATEVTQAQVTDASNRYEKAKNDAARVAEMLHNATCPTCHRPMENVDPVLLEQEYEEKFSLVRGLDAEYLNIQLSYKTWITHQGAKQRLDSARRALEELQSNRQDTEIRLLLEQLAAQLDELTDQLSLQIKHNAKVEATTRQRESLKAKLAKLVVPEGTPSDVLADTTLLEIEFSNARTAFHVATNDNTRAVDNNALIHTLEERLSLLPVPESGTVEIDLSPIETALVQAGEARDALLEEQAGNQVAIHDLELRLQPLVIKLAEHEKASEHCKEFYDLAENYRYIVQLLTNSRAGFISKAMATIFGVTSEFCKLSTDGDIEEVLFDGTIKYREKGVVRGKLAASGAQKSLIGLGMKLGIASLVLTDFEALLLDEATAAMSDEISLQAMLAMSSLCGQSISISHRKMDVAGNVIELG